jgi:hypothetical protein
MSINLAHFGNTNFFSLWVDEAVRTLDKESAKQNLERDNKKRVDGEISNDS